MFLTPFADTPFAAEGKELAAMLKRKAADEEIQPVIDRIHSAALDQALDPLVTSTDVYVTAVCWVGSKSLSHVLACIERTKDRLLDAGAASEAARAQIITAVMAYWSAHPGIAVSIVEKLLNYSIITPGAVIDWALVGDRASLINGSSGASGRRGSSLAKAWVFELILNTVAKVTGRLRQLVATGEGAETQEDEVAAMRELFRAMEDALVSWAQGTKDQLMDTSADADADAAAKEGGGDQEDLVRRWGQRWLRVFRRRSAIEEAFLVEQKARAEASAAAATAAAAEETEVAPPAEDAVDVDVDAVAE